MKRGINYVTQGKHHQSLKEAKSHCHVEMSSQKKPTKLDTDPTQAHSLREHITKLYKQIIMQNSTTVSTTIPPQHPPVHPEEPLAKLSKAAISVFSYKF